MLECQHICLSLSIFQIIWSYLKHSINLSSASRSLYWGPYNDQSEKTREQAPVNASTQISYQPPDACHQVNFIWKILLHRLHINCKIALCLLQIGFYLPDGQPETHLSIWKNSFKMTLAIFIQTQQYLPWISKSNKLGLIVKFTPTCKVKPHPKHISCIICLFRL